jgi:hypothetical protein
VEKLKVERIFDEDLESVFERESRVEFVNKGCILTVLGPVERNG